MTNEERYTTVGKRCEAFARFCLGASCAACPVSQRIRYDGSWTKCSYAWLDLPAPSDMSGVQPGPSAAKTTRAGVTNAELYTTPQARSVAFAKFCDRRDCTECPVYKQVNEVVSPSSCGRCAFAWLEQSRGNNTLPEPALDA